MTLPELKEFDGSDEDAYEKWRQLLLQKMEIDLDLDEGYSEAERQALLRTKVSGDAYDLVKDQEMDTYMDWVEILDDYYGDSASDKVQQAHADFSAGENGPLAMKRGESVREWKVRFQRAVNRVNYPEDLLFQHVRKLVMTPIYNYAQSKHRDGESFKRWMKYAVEWDKNKSLRSNPRDKSINKATGSRRSVRFDSDVKSNDGKERSAASSGASGSRRRNAYDRTDEERQVLADKKACFKCGEVGHQARDKPKPCDGKEPTPSRLIRILIDYFKGKRRQGRLQVAHAEETSDNDSDASNVDAYGYEILSAEEDNAEDVDDNEEQDF